MLAVALGASAADVTDVLNNEWTGISGTVYTAKTDLTASSDAVYSIQCAGNYSSIQLRTTSNNSGIVTTESGGSATTLKVTWNSNTNAARVIQVYGKDEAYASPSDLYDTAKQGTLIGEIGTTATELDLEGYEYIGIRSKSSALYLDEIQITWSTGSGASLGKPQFDPSSASFVESQEVAITHSNTSGSIYYTIDGTEPTTASTLYEGPFTVTETTTVKAIVSDGTLTSSVAEATYTKLEKWTIADVQIADAGTSVYVEGTVVAAGDAGIVIYDGTDYLYCYAGSGNTIVEGSKVRAIGTTTTYGGARQLPIAAVEVIGTEEVTHPTPTVLTGEDIEKAYDEKVASRIYVTYTGTLTLNGNYYNIAVEGTTNAIASIIKPFNADEYADLDGKEIVVTGYQMYVNNKYVYTIATSIEEVKEKFTILMADNVANGTIAIDPIEAAAGDIVTVTVVPADGYVLESIVANGVNSNQEVILSVSPVENVYTFEMIGDDVVVIPVFAEKPFEPVDLSVADYQNSWLSDVGGVGDYTKDVAQREQYLTNTTTQGKILYQTISGLENGTYTVRLVANASFTDGRGFTSDAQPNELGRVVVYANDVKQTIPVVNQTAVGTNNIVELEGVVVTDGTISMGLEKIVQGSNWHTIQITGLTYTSQDEVPFDGMDAYWQGVRDAVTATSAYAAITGSEYLNLAGAETADAIIANLPPFFEAKSAYGELETAITAAQAAGVDTSAAEQEKTSANMTAERALELAAELNAAARDIQYANASEDNPMVTDFVVNPSVTGGIAPWQSTTNAQNQALANNQSGFPNQPFYENWNPSNFTGKMYQVIENIPNGIYELSMWAFASNFDGSHQFIYANNDKTYLTQGAPNQYTVRTTVLDGKIEIGLQQDASVNNWMGLDDAVLTYYGKVDYKVALREAIATAETVDSTQPMNTAIGDEFLDALDNAVMTEANADATDDEIIAVTVALQNATAAAQTSISSYANTAVALNQLKQLVEATNVYTQEAYDEYYGQWVTKYDEGTLTDTEASGLENPFVITGWHDNVKVDNFLLSAWDTNPDFNNAPYYINTWSSEGTNDGSGFVVPFFEYWTGDDASLGERALTATVTDLKPGNYSVTAWTRVRLKNGGAAPTTGITLQANDGEPVDVTTGAQVGTSQFYLGEFTAIGVVGDDGVLTIKYNVAADNNISWLSFQNVKYARVADPVELAAAFDWQDQQEVTELDELKVTFSATNLEDNDISADGLTVKYSMVIMDEEYNGWYLEDCEAPYGESVVPFDQFEDDDEELGFAVEAGKTYELTLTADLFDVDGAKIASITGGYEPTHIHVIGAAVDPILLEAIALAEDEDGVAVGKLIAAIADYKETPDADALQAAIDQFKTDNADQEKDQTAKVATNGWKNYDGAAAGVCATQFAPAITTYDGRTNVQLAEVYEGNVDGVNRTGTIIYQDITGLTNGTYKVGFYGNAFYTSGRGFDSPMADGAEDVAYVFANDEREFIVANIATSTTENNFRQFDVEVTDGTIRLGMGKEQAGTNWHTMQIYQLTWFTTAKDVYAQDQQELITALAEAQALIDDANKTEGKQALQTAIDDATLAVGSNWYNIPEIEEIINNLKTATDDFVKANYFIDFAAGEYYVIDAETGLMMAAGHNYGTRGIVNEMGLDLILTPDTETHGVTIDSRVSNGGANHFLGTNLYMDAAVAQWFLEYQGFGFYITNGTQYINLDDENNLVMSDTPREFIIVTAEGVKEQRMEELAEATENVPVDATFLLQNPNFNRNDQRVAAWTVVATNSNLNGGNEVNNCAESYQSASGFTISQVVEGAPAGKYTMTAQGFFRQDDNVEEEAPVFFANGVTAEVPVKTGEENNMANASESFTNGLYTIEPIEFIVGDDGKIEVGVTTTGEHQWVIFDNFQLTYYGPYVETVYNINLPDLAGATITTDPEATAAEGAQVTITVVPEEGFGVESVAVNDASGAPIAEVTPAVGADNIYIFTMPAADVFVDVILNEVEPSSDYTYLIQNPAYLYHGNDGTYCYYDNWTFSPELPVNKERNYTEPMNLVTYSGNVPFTISQTVEGVPAGQYRLSVYGFYRAGSLNNEAALYNDGQAVPHNLAMFAEIGDAVYTQPIMTLYEGGVPEGTTAPGTTQHPYTGQGLRYVPNSAVDARNYYIAGFYRNDLIIEVEEDGTTMTIGLNHPSNATLDEDYCPIGAWELERLGDVVNAVEEDLIVERYPGLGYSTTSATVDFTAAKEFLGVDEVTTDMLYIINPDLTEIKDYTQFDGWFNGDGVAETWGSNTKINVKFFEAIPNGTYTVCDMNGADEVGSSYTVSWGLTANDKWYIYNITVNFVEAPSVDDIVISDNIIDGGSVSYYTNEGQYTEKVIVLSDDTKAAIAAELGVESLDGLTTYGYNPTTQELLSSYAGFDGWRDVNGDFANHSGNGTVPVCVKWTDGTNFPVYNITGLEPATYEAYWALATEQAAVLIKFTVVYEEAPAVEITYSDLNVIGSEQVDITFEAGTSYQGATASVDMEAVLSTLGIESLDDVTIYAVVPDGTLEANYGVGSSDGWRNKEGYWQSWGDAAYYYVKADFTRDSNQIYEVGTYPDKTNAYLFTTKYVFVKDNATHDAYQVDVVITYGDVVGINGILAGQNGEQTIFDLNGRRVSTITKGGLYIINGKKVFVK